MKMGIPMKIQLGIPMKIIIFTGNPYENPTNSADSAPREAVTDPIQSGRFFFTNEPTTKKQMCNTASQ